MRRLKYTMLQYVTHLSAGAFLDSRYKLFHYYEG